MNDAIPQKRRESVIVVN